MLRAFRQCNQPGSVRRSGHRSALRQIGGLLDPATKAQTAAFEPGVQLKHRIGTVPRVQQCVRHRGGAQEILGTSQHVGDRMIGRQGSKRGAELAQIPL